MTETRSSSTNKFLDDTDEMLSTKKPDDRHDNKNYPRSLCNQHIDKYLSKEDLLNVAKVKGCDLTAQAKKMINCVGCRKSVENMFNFFSFPFKEECSHKPTKTTKQQPTSKNKNFMDQDASNGFDNDRELI